MTKVCFSNKLPIQPEEKFSPNKNKIAHHSNNPYSSMLISPATRNTNIYSLASLTVILFCFWSSMIFVVQPIQCRTLVKEAINKSPIQVLANGQKSNLINLVKRNADDGLFSWDNNNAHVKPIEACQELLSATLLRNLAKNDLALLEKSAILNTKIFNIFNDHLDDRYLNSDHKNSYVVHNDDQLVDQHYLPVVSHKKRINETNFQFDYKSKQIKQCIKLLMATSSRIISAPAFRQSNFDLNNLQRKKLSLKQLAMKRKSSSAEIIVPERSKLNSWKQIDSIQQMKHNEKMNELVNRSSMPISNIIKKRVIFLLVNMPTIAPLIEKFLVQQESKSNRNDGLKSSSYVHRPQSTSFLDNLLKWKWSKDHPEALITANGQVMDSLIELADSDSSFSSLSYKLTNPELSKVLSNTDINVNASMPINYTAQKLINKKTPELEVPRTKKILTKTMILHSDPWDKEGIRFKRSSEEELDRRGQKGQEQYISIFDIFGQEGIRFKKSPFDDEGIRYKKSPFDDEGIRYKKSPFDDEGIRYKKSPFDDEGIRYKKSSLI